MAAKNIDIPKRFDPREMTVEDFIKEYRNVKGAGKDYGQLFYTRPDLQKLLKKPVIEVISQEMTTDVNSPLNKGIENFTSESMKQTFRGTLRGIERNVYRAMDQLAIGREGFVLPSEQIVVEAGTGTAKKTDKVAFNPELIGQWYVKAQDFIAKNPKQAPSVLAFMYALQTGFRPDEVLQTDSRHIVKPRNAGDPMGVFMSPANMQKKTGNIMNAPLSSHAAGILALQSQLNAGLKGDTPFVFMIEDAKTGKPRPVTTTDVNNALKQIKVPGILIDITGETPVDKDTFDEMYDARRMNATLYSLIDVDETRAAMLKGRDVKKSGSGREITYIGPAPGVYKSGSKTDVEKFAAYIQGKFEEAGGKYIEGVDEKQLLTFKKIGLDPNEGIHNLRLSRPLDIVIEDSTSKVVGGGPSQDLTDIDSAKTIAKDGGSKVLNKYRARGKSLGKLGLGVLAVEGLTQSYQKGYQEATGAGAGPGMAMAAGVALSAYENVLEPVPLGFMRAQPVGEGSDVLPTDETGRPSYPFIERYEAGMVTAPETELNRQLEIEKMDARNAAIDEQMKRIQAYDEAMATEEKKPDVQIELYTRDDPRYLGE